MTRSLLVVLAVSVLSGCDSTPRAAATLDAQASSSTRSVSGATPGGARDTISIEVFAGLIERVSEEGGFFDTDNLISNETGYLNVVDALVNLGHEGGAYVGVGPDQNYSYIAHLRPEIAFITDVRRDNMLHHVLLKALVESSDTPIAFLAALHGVDIPAAVSSGSPGIEESVALVDEFAADVAARGPPLPEALRARIEGYGLPLSADDYETIRRFHGEFIRRGLDLRFTTFGRPPRPYYPTYRELVLETDADGDLASWLSDPALYDVVRGLHLANRIVPVVGDMSGSSAVREIGVVLEEMGLSLTAFYTSNVEFYLWQGRTFDRWVENVATFPLAANAVVIRSYFPNFGGGHPSSIPGYYATQTLQPFATLLGNDFTSYLDLVTRNVVPLR